MAVGQGKHLGDTGRVGRSLIGELGQKPRDVGFGIGSKLDEPTHHRDMSLLVVIGFDFHCSEHSLLPGSDTVALTGFLDGLVVYPDAEPALLQIGDGGIPLLGKRRGKNHASIILT